jgi:phospholipid/cholesterol/gamma-HCH transport system permease protein
MSSVQPARHWQVTLRQTRSVTVRNLNAAALLVSLMLSPSSYRQAPRTVMARHLYRGTAPMLPWFTLLVAMVSLVLIHIVVATAAAYGLSRYALETVIRVLVLELIPLVSALFVAVNVTLPGGVALYRRRVRENPGFLAAGGMEALHAEAVARVLAGLFAVVTLAVVSCLVALVLTYLVVHGPNSAAFDGFTRKVGQVFNPAVALIFVLKTFFFSLAVSFIPVLSGLNTLPSSGRRSELPEVQGLLRMFLLILLIELVSLVGNYY